MGDENSIYLMEEELTNVLVTLLESKISELLKLLIAKQKVALLKELKSVFDIDDIKNDIVAFFENFEVTDLFTEIYELDRNKNILDKQEFYFYFCDISFNRIKYPIFYIPFSLEKTNYGLQIDFDSQVYINKKALGYVVQEYNKKKGKKGNLKTITDRIIYLAEHKDDFAVVLSDIINEITNLFELDSNINISISGPQVAKSLLVRMSNSCYVSLFDKSDEALVNDYEEILQLLSNDDDVLAQAFDKLIDDFIHKNPKPFNPEVENEWDDTATSDKLVFASPIPLNSEQRQILFATNKKDSKYITVEGPPGTGKSHTITAIAFEAILKNQCVLILSDKKEALDVVEVKIAEAMNKVRMDKKFQNPILRLGKTGNTYNQILSKSSLENIKTFYRAVKKDYQSLEQNIEKSVKSLKEDLEAEILACNEIYVEEVSELFGLEYHYEQNGCHGDVEEILKQPDSAIELEEFKRIFLDIKSKCVNDQNSEIAKLSELFGIPVDSFENPSKLLNFTKLLIAISEDATEITNVFEEKSELLKNFHTLSDGDLEKLEAVTKAYETLRNPVFGYFLKGGKLEKINKEFKDTFSYSKFDYSYKSLAQLNNVLEILSFASKLKQNLLSPSDIDFDYLNIIHRFIQDDTMGSLSAEMAQLAEDIEYLIANFNKYPNTLNKIGLIQTSLASFGNNQFTEMSDRDFDMIIRYINLKQKITKDFNNIPLLNYADQSRDIENLTTLKMTYLLDGRVIDFYEQNRNDANTIRNVIRQKRKFNRDDFLRLKEAFPCILAGVRDYAEYIPLEPELFDLVVIDEASQVSIAQAFPALLRAKKVVILGDKKQFSNVKAAHARSDTNKEYLNSLKETFRKHISDEGSKLVKLEKFNIKTSILEFFEFINNYNTQLLKHFRGYKELISYSNKYFYQNNFHVMKIRGKPINEVLKFSFVDHDGRTELIPNTNIPEIEFISSELKALKENNSDLSVGIITPHTNQQKMFMEMINKSIDRDYYFENLKLKIMTFDTCQGEERDIIFYSMVATKELDRLWGIFIKDLASVDLEEDGRIKAQRLNVGFSRAKECMHFVLSQPLDQYSGSIGEALRHYNNVLIEAKQEKTAADVDSNSPMESQVLNWFYQTEFWKENKDNIEFTPQFKIGKYLKQLDKTYKHPNYIVDFLLFYQDGLNGEHKIIIEYDGFREHFKDVDVVNEFNYQDYYSDDDVYRKKVLEGYGYKFLRINRFNTGKDPIKTLDQRIKQLIAQRGFSDAKTEDESHSGFSKLSTQLRQYFTKHLNPSESPDASDIEALQAIEEAKAIFDEKLKTSFQPAIGELEGLNYPGFSDPQISLTSKIDAVQSLKHETAVQFNVSPERDDNTALSLPEQYNGLGYQNLISMVFSLIRFRDEWMRVGKAAKKHSGDDTIIEPLHIVLIEEPEAHLHAQVQQVFIKKAYQVLRSHKKLKDSQLNTQMIVSTHSSHIAHELNFTCLRYFRREPATQKGEIPSATIVNLSNTFGDGTETSKFATRYIKSTHCDLFFADAAILVEGSAERMLVPHFIRHKYPKLDQSYISMLEIGGSHAHRLRPLIETLGLLSLVITDLDSVTQSDNGRDKKIFPERDNGYRTGNTTLKEWIPTKELLDDLFDCSDDNKQSDNKQIRVAYQCPIKLKYKDDSDEGEAIPYTFEDSLALTNLKLFRDYQNPKGLLNKLQEALGKDTLNEASEEMFNSLGSGSKAEMALELLYLTEPSDLEPPDYISKGLKWLEDKLAERKQDFLATAVTEVKND